MTDFLPSFGRLLGFSFAAGINLYATVAIVGLASRYGWVDLPPQYRAFDNTYIIAAALILYVVEFVADKIPWVDTTWDAVHTVVRPIGGAAIAVAGLGEASPAMQAMVGLIGAGIAGTTHMTKAGTRVAVNTSPEPFSNWILSLAEDGFVVALGLLALQYPLVAGLVVLVGLVLIGLFARWIIKSFRRRFRRAPAAV
jgi:hypothetical protein